MADDLQLDIVQHPTLGKLKFPKDMPLEERNASVARLEESSALLTKQTNDTAAAAGVGGPARPKIQMRQNDPGAPAPGSQPYGTGVGSRSVIEDVRDTYKKKGTVPAVGTAIGDAMEAFAPAAAPAMAETVATRGVIGLGKEVAKGVAKSYAGSEIGEHVGRKAGSFVSPEAADTGGQLGKYAGALAGPFVGNKTFARIPVIGRMIAGDEAYAEVKAGEKAAQLKADVAAGVRQPPKVPQTPEEIAAQKVTQKIADRAAEEKAGIREPQADIDARRTARNAERDYNKRGDENMALQKRLDESIEARTKAEAAHADSLKEIETARQKEITAQAKLRQIQDQIDRSDAAKDAAGLKKLRDSEREAIKDANEAAAQKERLRTMHGDDLMKRVDETKTEEVEAQKALEKAVPPSQREIHAARVARAKAESAARGPDAYSTEEWEKLTPIEKAKATARWEETKRRASISGMVHSGRAATTSPYRSNESIKLGSPDYPAPQRRP